MRKTACPVVWEGHGAQSPSPDPIVGKPSRLAFEGPSQLKNVRRGRLTYVGKPSRLASVLPSSIHMELKWKKIRKIRCRIDVDFHDRLHKLRPLGVDRALGES